MIIDNKYFNKYMKNLKIKLNQDSVLMKLKNQIWIKKLIIIPIREKIKKIIMKLLHYNATQRIGKKKGVQEEIL
jgi:hypothetical protein